jgi:hypothetical protein
VERKHVWTHKPKGTEFVTCKLRENEMTQADLVKSLKLHIAKWTIVQNPIDLDAQENKYQ